MHTSINRVLIYSTLLYTYYRVFYPLNFLLSLLPSLLHTFNNFNSAATPYIYTTCPTYKYIAFSKHSTATISRGFKLSSGMFFWACCYKLRQFAANYTIAAVVYGLRWFAGTVRFATKLQQNCTSLRICDKPTQSSRILHVLYISHFLYFLQSIINKIFFKLVLR